MNVNGNTVFENDAGAGYQPNNAGVQFSSPVDVDTDEYDIASEIEFDIDCTAAGSNADAEDLTIIMLFVCD